MNIMWEKKSFFVSNTLLGGLVALEEFALMSSVFLKSLLRPWKQIDLYSKQVEIIKLFQSFQEDKTFVTQQQTKITHCEKKKSCSAV